MIKWINFKEEKPKKSGFYFIRVWKEIDIAYYDAVLEKFLFFEYDYVCFYTLNFVSDLEWGRMPRYSRSKLINDLSIKL